MAMIRKCFCHLPLECASSVKTHPVFVISNTRHGQSCKGGDMLNSIWCMTVEQHLVQRQEGEREHSCLSLSARWVYDHKRKEGTKEWKLLYPCNESKKVDLVNKLLFSLGSFVNFELKALKG